MKKFISFEGGEGSGKSTQSKLLVKSLKKININTFLTREPGGTKFSEKIRKILIGTVDYKMLPETELLLIYAARHEHVKKNNSNLKKKLLFVIVCSFNNLLSSSFKQNIIKINCHARTFR